jgi:hypothetical protein
VVLLGQVAGWPAVAAAQAGDEATIAYLCRDRTRRPIRAIAAAPSAQQRFFYTPDLAHLNFVHGSGQFEAFLADLLRATAMPDTPAMAVQSELIDSLLPSFVREHRLALLSDVPARIWIGNRIRVATHWDAKAIIACCVAGHRGFTLYPPDQIGGLYPGPFEITPTGVPVSMVDPAAFGLARFPRHAKAAQHASTATLVLCDAIYIPYGWWHGVESLDSVSILVNYWWTPDRHKDISTPYDALMHAVYAVRHMLGDQRRVWRGLLDYYVFGAADEPGVRLPAAVQRILDPPSRENFAAMRDFIRQVLG